jgi:hypothetical protein
LALMRVLSVPIVIASLGDCWMLSEKELAKRLVKVMKEATALEELDWLLQSAFTDVISDDVWADAWAQVHDGAEPG